MTIDEIKQDIEQRGWKLLQNETQDGEKTAQVYDPPNANPDHYLFPFSFAWHTNEDEALREAYRIALEVKSMIEASDRGVCALLQKELEELHGVNFD